MTYEQILENLKNKKFHPVYLLTGEESYYIDCLTDVLEEEVLLEEEKDFNLTVVYGKDTDAGTIADYAKQYPMMAERRVVIVKEAQEVKDLEELLSYVENPLTTTLLVLCYKYKKLDKRKSFAKAIEKGGVFYESPRIYENKIPDWIRMYVREKGFGIQAKACLLLAEQLGSDLTRIVNEVDKLLINVPAGTEINDKLVEKYIGIHKDYNVFELQRALGNRDIFKANQIAGYFAGNPKENPLVKIVAILLSFFIKVLMFHQLKDKSKNAAALALGVNPYFVQDYQTAAHQYKPGQITRIVSLLREYDMKSKGVDNVSADDGELLKELVFRILH